MRRLALLALIVAAPVAAARAQLTASATSALAFGNVYPGRTRTVAPGDAQAAVFVVTGVANSTIGITLTLPTQLFASGRYVTPDTWTGQVVTNGGASTVNFTPVSNSEVAVTLGGDGTATIRVGARVFPTAAQQGASYSNTIAFFATRASTQERSLTTQANATLTVLQPIVLTATPMNFGAVYVGQNRTIAPSAAGAMRFGIEGQLSATVQVTFDNVPTSLARVGGGGSLTVGTWQAQAGGANCTGTSFTPATGVQQNLTLSASSGIGGMSTLCLGATVTPTALQPAGQYRATVTISVQYTGS